VRRGAAPYEVPAHCACAFYEDIEERTQSDVVKGLANSAALDLTPMTHTFNICIPFI